MENLIKPLQQWAMENVEERGVLVIAADKEKNGCVLTGDMTNVAMAIATQASKSPEVYRVLLMGLFAATKNNRFLSLRARLIAWLLK
jgi:inosine-uridine nucleoside N-ribohydrolase